MNNKANYLHIDEQLNSIIEKLLLNWHKGARKRINEGGLDQQTSAKIQ